MAIILPPNPPVLYRISFLEAPGTFTQQSTDLTVLESEDNDVGETISNTPHRNDSRDQHRDTQSSSSAMIPGSPCLLLLGEQFISRGPLPPMRLTGY